MLKKALFFVFILNSLFALVFSQDAIVTANEYFKLVSDKYAAIKDYQANADILINKENMRARVTYLSPDKVRFDFSNPQDQTIVFNGETLTIYLPDSAAVLRQDVNTGSMVTSEGFSLMRRYYSVSYETSQSAVLLDEGSDEKVVRLVLWRRTTSEAFRYIKLSINPSTKMVRRVEAVTSAGVTYRMDFFDYEINQGLTAQRFSYDLPSAANTYDNFMFSE